MRTFCKVLGISRALPRLGIWVRLDKVESREKKSREDRLYRAD